VTAGPLAVALALLIGAAGTGTALPAGAAIRTPVPAATPGMGAARPCSPTVVYSTSGRSPTPHPLPSASSSVGGKQLAATGLQVTAVARTAPPAPKATAWLVADLDSGQVLAACNAHIPLAPASSLKVLTALALVHRIDAAAQYTARDEDVRVDGTKVGMVKGSVYTATDLWHALLMSSANDAATGLAAMDGGIPAATSAMHATARSLGAMDTVVRNTSGLDEPGQVSSAYDLALFGRAALADPVITRYFQTRVYRFPGPGTQVGAAGRTSFQIQNHDRLLANYPGALGVKNGWTSTTGGSFVGAAQRGGRRLIVTVLAADPETWHMCAALLDWGFTATDAGVEGVGRLVTGPEAAQAGTSVDAANNSNHSNGSGKPAQPQATTASAAKWWIGLGAVLSLTLVGTLRYRRHRRLG
jgi:D-alanyl-D-alanine carboxypeptidase (penicillin-binding protein 5/6)